MSAGSGPYTMHRDNDVHHTGIYLFSQLKYYWYLLSLMKFSFWTFCSYLESVAHF